MSWTGQEWVIFGIIYIVFGIMASLVMRRKRKDPISDERTEKIAGKSARMTLVVIMGVIAIIAWGNILELFKLETQAALAIIFSSLLISMLGFLQYYGRKEV
ncbi:MAG: DUF2178 domain-containing protein [Candidatus Aenigmarchaeota archaeon]|nr:DUF2178 domain-containing protein [Candidatus Aenigmarchaeota archaeon]